MLQQATAFRPFMRESIPFTGITGLTGNHEIIRIIGASTSDRDDMVNMKGAPSGSKFLMAIIASAFLPLILVLDVFRGMPARNSFYTSTMSCIMHPHLLRMRFIVLLTGSPMSLPMRLNIVSIILSIPLSMSLLVLSNILLDSFLISLIILLIINMHMLSIGFVVVTTTLLTLWLQSLPIGMKVLRGSEKKATTWASASLLRGIILRYNILHGRSLLLLSRSGGASNTPGHTTLLPPQYTINPPQKQDHILKGGNLPCLC